jgi:hypothetical protein
MDDELKLIIKQLDRMEAKDLKIEERLDSIDLTLAKQEIILAEHVKRSNLLEARLVPIEKSQIVIHGLFKIIGVASTVVGLAVGVLKLLRKL